MNLLGVRPISSTEKICPKRNKTNLLHNKSLLHYHDSKRLFYSHIKLYGKSLNLNQTTPSTHRATSTPGNPANEGDSNR